MEQDGAFAALDRRLPRRPGASFEKNFFPLTWTIPGLLVSRLVIGSSPFGRSGWIELAASIINWNWWVRTFGPTLVRDPGGGLIFCPVNDG